MDDEVRVVREYRLFCSKLRLHPTQAGAAVFTAGYLAAREPTPEEELHESGSA